MLRVFDKKEEWKQENSKSQAVREIDLTNIFPRILHSVFILQVGCRIILMIKECLCVFNATWLKEVDSTGEALEWVILGCLLLDTDGYVREGNVDHTSTSVLIIFLCQ